MATVEALGSGVGTQAAGGGAAAPLLPRLLRPFLLVAPAVLLVFVLLVLPYVNMVVMSLREPSTTKPYEDGFTLANYAKALGDPYYLGVLGETFWIGLLVTVVCLAVGWPVAYHLARTTSRWRGVLYACVLSPLLVGVVVRCYGWIILLANNGLINQGIKGTGLADRGLPLMYNQFGVTVGLVHVFLPFMILPLVSAIQSTDPALESAARSLGASRLRSIWRVTVPLSLPGIQAGTVLVFVLTVSSYVTPILLGGLKVKTAAVLVVQQLLDAFLWPFGAALALVLSLAGCLAIALYGWLLARLMRGIA